MSRLKLVPRLPHYVTLHHVGGSRREVTVLPVGGAPPRVRIWWPLCGVYELGVKGELLPEVRKKRTRTVRSSHCHEQLSLWPESPRAPRGVKQLHPVVQSTGWKLAPSALPLVRAVVFQFRRERDPKC
jgi:hypothetical protein